MPGTAKYLKSTTINIMVSQEDLGNQYILQMETQIAPLKLHRMATQHACVCPSIANPTILIAYRLNIEISY